MPWNPEVCAARDFLGPHRTDYLGAFAGLSGPRPALYNFVTSWVDGLAAEDPTGVALRIVGWN